VGALYLTFFHKLWIFRIQKLPGGFWGDHFCCEWLKFGATANMNAPEESSAASFSNDAASAISATSYRYDFEPRFYESPKQWWFFSNWADFRILEDYESSHGTLLDLRIFR